ncbi:MAG: hypothetical protein RLZ16_1094 [Bacteroidota bacterium]|jgi:hypothetical protein
MASFNIGRKFPILLLSILSLSACTRISTSELGLDFVSMDSFNTKDTILVVETETVDRPDSLRIYGGDVHILGNLTDDALFGATSASMYFQLIPNSFPFYLQGSKDSIIVDSAVLVMSYVGFYGDSTRPLKLNLRRISTSTPMLMTSAYAVNYPEVYNIQTDAALANTYTLDFTKIGDSVFNRFEKASRQIRIPLLKSFADMFIKTYDSTNAYKSDSTLRDYFPGFALTADASSNNNVLLKTSLADTNTKLGLYYRTNSLATPGKKDTLVAYFKFSSYYNAQANFIKRNRAGSEASRHMNGNANDSLVYVQSSPGTMVKVKIPGLKNFANKLVHRAELIAEQVPTEAPTALEKHLLPPNYLFLAAYDSASPSLLRSVPNDFLGSTDATSFYRFGGQLLYKTIQGVENIATYNFNVSRYVQGVISRKDSMFDFRILAPVNDSIRFVPPRPSNTMSSIDYLSSGLGNSPATGRVRLGGGSHSKYKMRLRIYYSDL